ncbi:MAG TPA: NAD(P)H-hydrate dehydratase [Usitatibacter sp.]|nr:NAD(P)H-hydrate dehydratase [Usitatibacter sp.]
MKPVPVLTPDEMRAVEARAAPASGPTLMERAGRAAAQSARRLASDTGGPILVVAGPGNNGGDAWVAAENLLEGFHRVLVLEASAAEPKAPEARAARAAFAARGGTIVREWPDEPRLALVVDGLLGLGLARDVDPAFRALIERINASGAPVLAIDVPSGLDSRTGSIRGAAVHATRTVTFLAHKVGLHTADGPDCCGAIECDDLGAGAAVAAEAHGRLLTPELAAPWLAARRRNVHKGDFGTLAVVGGQRGMVGAALLAARAGLLAGAGRVYAGLLGADAPAVDLVHPELMLRSVEEAVASARVVVAGPGAGRSPSATSASLFERTVLPSLLAGDRALVLDADALNVLGANESLASLLARRPAATILTPHPAEAGRLLGTDAKGVQGDRLGAALLLARRFHAHVVLKGAGSLCAFPDGRWSVNTTGNPGLASPGTGDVLAGIIGALLCQGLDAEHALQYAVCLHGAAADACVARGTGPVGLTASEVAVQARRLLNAWTAGVV